MNEVKAADLPVGTRVGWGDDTDDVVMTAGTTEIVESDATSRALVKVRWRNDHTAVSDRFVQWMLADGAVVLRHGYGEETEI